MSRFFLSVAILTCVASAARADSGPQLAPINENYQSPKMTKLRQLNAQLADAMAAWPTVDQLTDDKALEAAYDKLSAAADEVHKALVPAIRPNGAVAFSVVQDNVEIVRSRAKFLKALRRVGVALSALGKAADAHREPTDAQRREVADAFQYLDAVKAVGPELYAAAVKWQENLGHKIDEVVWPADLPAIELSRKALAAAPIAVHGTVEDKRWKPIAAVNVTAPLHELREYGNFDRLGLRIRGPVKNEQGLVVGPTDGLDWKEIDAGTYVIEARGHGDPATIDVVLTGPDTPIDRFAQVGAIAADAPIDHHLVEAIYPFLREVDSAYERQKLFATAPRALFVYARDDLDKHDASTRQNSDALPRKDEPLLVARGPNGNGFTIYDAEGFSWDVHDLKMLAPAPAGAPALPETIHPLALDFEPAMFDANAQAAFASFPPGAPIEKIVKPFEKTVDTWNACVQKVLDKYGGAKANDYDVVTYSGGHVQKVQGLSDIAWNEADRTCGTKAYDRKLQAFDKQLSDAHNKMRAQALAEIRAAWAK